MTTGIPLGGKVAAGRIALIDDEDFSLVSQYRWHVQENKHGNVAYARTVIRRADGHRTHVLMHCLILNYHKGIDHAGACWLDSADRLPAAGFVFDYRVRCHFGGTSSQYKGVKKRDNRWEASIEIANQYCYLGLFTTEEDAARAYDATALAAWGEFARLNLPLNQITVAESQQNRSKKEAPSSQYKGVSWHKSTGKWRAAIMINGKQRHLGEFTDEIEAARTYDAAAYEAGEFTRLNFPHN